MSTSHRTLWSLLPPAVWEPLEPCLQPLLPLQGYQQNELSSTYHVGCLGPNWQMLSQYCIRAPAANHHLEALANATAPPEAAAFLASSAFDCAPAVPGSDGALSTTDEALEAAAPIPQHKVAPSLKAQAKLQIRLEDSEHAALEVCTCVGRLLRRLGSVWHVLHCSRSRQPLGHRDIAGVPYGRLATQKRVCWLQFGPDGSPAAARPAASRRLGAASGTFAFAAGT